MRISFILLLIFSVFPARGAASEDSSISVKAEISKAFITIGEKVEYRVTVTHDPAIRILSKIVLPPSDAFEVKEVHDFSEKQGKEIVEGRRFIITTYELGEFILDPVSVRYQTLQGEEKVIETNRLYVTVTSVDASGKPKTDIRDVKGVLELPRRWGWLVGTLLFILATAAGVFGWQQWKKRSLASPETQEPPLSPEDEALLRLSRLFDSDLLRQGRLKEYFLALSEILRNYFERRFEILAIESTTSEILIDLVEKGIAQSLLEKIREVLETADLVKFAKSKPSASEILKINRLSKAVIEEARPLASSGEETVAQNSLHGV